MDRQIDAACVTSSEITQALETAMDIIESNTSVFDGVCQNYASSNNFYHTCENNQWTTGFWPGELWIAYEYSRKDSFKKTALDFIDNFRNRMTNRIDIDHHDMGFIFSPSCVSAWKITSCREARDTALLAAEQLASRFQQKGQFIQAWGSKNDSDNYRYIIDCLLNTPLLYWAAAETGRQEYSEIASMHNMTCLKNSLRADGSTYHTFFMNPLTGEPDYGATHQGYSNDSFWSRGQAWGIYGFALAYKYTGNPDYLTAFSKVTDFFISHLPEDLIPYWDMIFTSGTEPRDSSSAAIAVCGLLEGSQYFESKERTFYKTLSGQILESLIKNCSVHDKQRSNGLLMHGTYCKKSPYNTCTSKGVDECVSWGDYFYMEALMRFHNNAWNPSW
jgi:unsaturated chondroitin disaccharide hydrolase